MMQLDFAVSFHCWINSHAHLESDEETPPGEPDLELLFMSFPLVYEGNHGILFVECTTQISFVVRGLGKLNWLLVELGDAVND